MKSECKVTELSHEDLVNLFSTALSGEQCFSVDYPKDFYEDIEHKEGDCWEDHIADVLLNDGAILITDIYANGCDNSIGRTGKILDNEDCVFTITLKDILSACSTNTGYIYARDMFDNDLGDFEVAYNLLQLIVFGDIIYG